MPRTFLVMVIALAAVATFPTRSLACDCCDCDSLGHHLHLQVIRRFDASLYTFHGDVPYQAGPTGGGNRGGVLGLGGQVTGPLAPRWNWSLDAGYGIGDLKTTTSSGGGPSNTFETQLSEIQARISADFHRGGFYCGPGFEYIHTTPIIKQTGFADIKPSAFNVYGFESHLGGYIPLNPRLRLFGETSELIGIGKFSDTFGTLKTETTDYVSLTSWRGGLNLRLGDIPARK